MPSPFFGSRLYTVVNVPVGVILKIVTEPGVPPPDVVPYKFPSLAWIGGAAGPSPSVRLKRCRVVNAPVGVILKTVPHVPGLLAPPQLLLLKPPELVVP